VCLAPGAAGTASRVARELFGIDRDFTWATPKGCRSAIGPYAHLMTRVEAKQLDALFEPPAPPVAEAPLPGGAAIAESITIDDFAKLDLRVARIVDASHVEGSTSC
jgi:methionyl-tRNA synthetase